MSQFVVTTRIGEMQKSEVWNDRTPLGVGHPFRWVLERTDQGVRVRTLTPVLNRLQKSSVQLVTEESLRGECELKLNDQISILIRPALRDLKTAKAFKGLEVQEELDSSNLIWFKKSARYAAVGMIAFVAMAMFWPKPSPKEVELIPAQFTKLVMTQPVKDPAPAQASGGQAAKTGTRETQTAKKVQNTAVAQAFRAKALNNAMSGLLKGGMTTLLAQSDFVRGHQKSADSGKMFDSKSKDLRATSTAVGNISAPQVKVASLGGDGVSVGGTNGIGYGKGASAGVAGQGKGLVKISSQVSGDLLGANVQEGLTKDEVGEVIHRHMSEIRYCYESAMLRQSDVEGKLIVDFTIGGAGAVKTTAVKTSTLPDPRLDDCILRRLVTWKFPSPKGGIDVAVSYPFIFKTLGR